MKKTVTFGLILLALTGCNSPRHDHPSLEEVERNTKAEIAEQSKNDSIYKEKIKEIDKTRLKPSYFIKRASSTTYTFDREEQVFKNLTSLGFNRGRTQVIDLWEKYSVEGNKTRLTRDDKEGKTEITLIYYYGEDDYEEYYVKILFSSEDAQQAFIRDVMNMKFCSKDGSKITIGQGENTFQNLYLKISGSRQIEIYTEQSLKFPK